MNSTSRLSLASGNASEETSGLNSTGTTASSGTSQWLDLRSLTLATVSTQWVIFLVGSLGNILVLVVLLWRRSRNQIGTQLFVGSLAASDIGMMFSTVWVEAYDELLDNWHFGRISCKLHNMWQWLTMNSSIWTLAALSVDRYFCISVGLYIRRPIFIIMVDGTSHITLAKICLPPFVCLYLCLLARLSKYWYFFKSSGRLLNMSRLTHDGVLHEIIEGRTKGKRTRGSRL